MSKLNITLDATMLDTFESCACKYNYRFNLCKTTDSISPALDRGSLVHVGLEHYYLALQKRLEFKERLELLELHTRNAWVESSDLNETEYMRVIAVLREHCERWRFQDEQFDIIAVETPFAYKLHEDENITLIMIGKIDLLVNWYDGNIKYERLPIDHKSYERDRAYNRKANQFTNYAKACNSNFLFVNKVGFQTSIKPELKHKRNVLTYDPIFFEQWTKNVVQIAYRYLDCVSTDTWPMNWTACDKFGRLCEYDEVCNSSSDTAGKMYKLEVMFKQSEKWDVSKILGVRE